MTREKNEESDNTDCCPRRGIRPGYSGDFQSEGLGPERQRAWEILGKSSSSAIGKRNEIIECLYLRGLLEALRIFLCQGIPGEVGPARNPEGGDTRRHSIKEYLLAG